MKNINQETGSATALEIAMLAALLDPGACKSGNSREALLHAMALKKVLSYANRWHRWIF